MQKNTLRNPLSRTPQARVASARQRDWWPEVGGFALLVVAVLHTAGMLA